MRAAATNHTEVADAVARHGNILCKRRFSPFLDCSAVARLLTNWLDQQADGVYHMADFDAVFATPLHAPPHIGIFAYRSIQIRSSAKIVGKGRWGGEKKPKPGEKKPEQKPDKKKQKQRRDGDREPREPRQPNTHFTPHVAFSIL